MSIFSCVRRHFYHSPVNKMAVTDHVYGILRTCYAHITQMEKGNERKQGGKFSIWKLQEEEKRVLKLIAPQLPENV